jgi:hypothetical protein
MDQRREIQNIPVPVSNALGQQRRPPVEEQISLRQFIVAWMRYHSIQIRWDMEREVARCLHRRWGG